MKHEMNNGSQLKTTIIIEVQFKIRDEDTQLNVSLNTFTITPDPAADGCKIPQLTKTTRGSDGRHCCVFECEQKWVKSRIHQWLG